MSLIHTVHTMNTNILPILLIVTMKNTNTNKISQSDESAKGRQMSEQKQEVYDEVQEALSQLGWSISNAKITMEEALEQAEQEVEDTLDKVVSILESID